MKFVGVLILLWVVLLVYIFDRDVSDFFEKLLANFKKKRKELIADFKKKKEEKFSTAVEEIKKYGRYLGQDDDYSYFLFQKKLVKLNKKSIVFIRKKDYHKIPVEIMNKLISWFWV